MAPSLRRAAAERGYLTSTSATMFSPDSASARLPSLVGIMLRTVPPPDGIFQVWNFSVLGSKRTSVLGLAPDSPYHNTSSLVMAMRRGRVSLLGKAYSLICSVLGSMLPILLAPNSAKNGM